MTRERGSLSTPKENLFAFRNAVFPRVEAAGLFGVGWDDVDDKHKALFKSPPGESGWDRLKAMFIADEYGHRSPEMGNILNASITAVLVGGAAGGYAGSRLAAQQCLEQFKVIHFKNDVERQKRLAAEMRMALLRKGFYWSWRSGLLTGTYLLIVTTVSVYRNESSLVEYIMAGGVVGTMFKFNSGMKRACIAGLAGSGLGAMAGGISVGLMWLTGSSLQEQRYSSQYRRSFREIENAGISSKTSNMERPADLTTDTFPPI